MRRRWIFLLCLFLAMTPAGRSAKSPSAKTKSPAAARSAWAEKTLQKMTLREKLGQMLVVYFFGGYTATESADYKDLMHLVEVDHVGGFILGTRPGKTGIEYSDVYASAILTNQMQKRAKIPLLIGADFERGTAMRLDEGTGFPQPMAVSATGDPRDAYTVGKITALEARAAGVQWIFAPDADVNINPANPIINIRSFGEDPQQVAERVVQFVHGVQENGALATVKHFPGHGDVSVDSHIGLATVPGDRARLESVELVPFRAAIDARVDSVMTGHLAVPAFEPDANVPATMSFKILTDLLRGDLHFQGLVVTDALDMGGVTTMFPPGEATVRAIAAGADVLLMSPSPEAAIEGLEAAVKSGRISLARIDDSVRRILEAKARLGLEKNRYVDVNDINAKIGNPEFLNAARDIADRGVTLLRDSAHALPLDATKPLRLLLVQISGDPDTYPGADFDDEFRKHVDPVAVIRIDTQYMKPQYAKLPSPDTYDAAVVVAYVRVADRKGTVGLPDDQVEIINQLIAGPKPVIIAALGSPYLISRFPNAKTWLAAFGTQEGAQRAAARAIFGQIPIGGKIPVTVPGATKRGDGIQLPANPMKLTPAPPNVDSQLQPAYKMLDDAVAGHAFPGGVLAVGHNNLFTIHAFGRFTYDKSSRAVTPETMYDLASITKPVATTTSIMLLSEDGRIDINLPVSRYLPEWPQAAPKDPDPTWRAKVTVRDLLLHDSGLPAHREYYKQVDGYDKVLALVLAEPLIREPGTKVEYSDLGFILLAEIVHRLSGIDFDAFANDYIFEPLQMNHTSFLPAKSLRSSIPPTEDDKDYRNKLVQGEVHDQNASAMGGIAGHAGLFSTAGDLATFAQMMLNGGIYAHQRLLARSTVDRFTAHVEVGESARAIGWDVPMPPSSSGDFFSRRAYGHTGYTGTSLWIDPEKDLFVILLTNRVYPSAENNKIREVRPALHNAVVEALGLVPGPAPAR